MNRVNGRIETGKRVLYLDYLRILATFFVILIHVSAQNWDNVEMTSYPWRVFCWVNNAARWAVPMFVMLSGALFLNPQKQVTVKTLYRKNILRMIFVFAVWACVYALYKIRIGVDPYTAKSELLHGYYHMWYFYLVVGLYIVTPVVRKITESRETAKYFLVIALLFAVVVPEGIAMLRVLKIPYTAALVAAVADYTNGMNFAFPNVFLIYYVMGCYLSMYEVGKWLRRTVYVLGIGSYIGVVLGMEQMAAATGTTALSFGLQFANVTMSASMFLFGKYVLSKIRIPEKWENAIRSVSKCTFGVYLVHVMILEQLWSVTGLNTLSFNPVVSVAVISVLVMGLSVVVALILNRIPLVKKCV